MLRNTIFLNRISNTLRNSIFSKIVFLVSYQKWLINENDVKNQN